MRKMEGVVTGIVKSLDDRNGLGRIELSFPWLSETTRSSWAPVAAPLAGKERGAFFMPEVGDEVLVAFEHGDFAHPYIVGFLWNGADKPPESTSQNRIILTPGGHTLRFEDKAGARKVILRSSTGHEVTLDDAGKAVTIKTAGGLSLTLDDNTTAIKLKGGGRTVTMSGGTLEIT